MFEWRDSGTATRSTAMASATFSGPMAASAPAWQTTGPIRVTLVLVGRRRSGPDEQRVPAIPDDPFWRIQRQDPAHRPRRLHVRRQGEERAERRRGRGRGGEQRRRPANRHGRRGPDDHDPVDHDQPGRRDHHQAGTAGRGDASLSADDRCRTATPIWIAGVIVHEYGHGIEQPADRWERRLPGQSREDAGRARTASRWARAGATGPGPLPYRPLGRHGDHAAWHRATTWTSRVRRARASGPPRTPPTRTVNPATYRTCIEDAGTHPHDPARGRLRVGQHASGRSTGTWSTRPASTRTSTTAGKRAGTTWPFSS